MVKNILATVGIVAIVAGIAVWQFGFFSDKARDVAQRVDRAAASARVDKAIDAYRNKIATFDERAREYNVKARKLEYAWNRDVEEAARLKEAVSRLSAAAKEAGLPKPSERASLTEEQRAIELPFGAKRIAAEDVYGTLDRWNDEYKTLETVANQKKESIDRMRAVSEQIRAKKSEMTAELAKMENRVRELSAARDVSKLNAELAEMEASVNGVAAGDSGKAMQTIQDEIDELNALADTYQDEAQTKKTELNPSDVLEPADAVDELDAYWN